MKPLNELEKIVVAFPTSKKWDGIALSINPNTTWRLITDNPDIDWNYPVLSSLPDTTWQIVQDHPEIKWKWVALSANENVATWKIIQDNPTKPWNVEKGFVKNPRCTRKFMLEHPEIKWDYKAYSKNPSLTFDTVGDNIDIGWDFNALSAHPNLDWKVVERFPDKPWNYDVMSKNLNITWEIVKANIKKDWDWEGLSGNSSVATWPIIMDNPKYQWDYDNLLALNINMTWLIVKDNFKQIFKKLKTVEQILMNPSFTWDDTKEFVEIMKKAKVNNPRSLLSIFSANPNLTLKIMQDNPKIRWAFTDYLSANKFHLDPGYITLQQRKSLKPALNVNRLVRLLGREFKPIKPISKIDMKKLSTLADKLGKKRFDDDEIEQCIKKVSIKIGVSIENVVKVLTS